LCIHINSTKQEFQNSIKLRLFDDYSTLIIMLWVQQHYCNNLQLTRQYRKPYDAAAVLFSLSSATTVTTSKMLTKFRNPGFTAPNIRYDTTEKCKAVD